MQSPLDSFIKLPPTQTFKCTEQFIKCEFGFESLNSTEDFLTAVDSQTGGLETGSQVISQAADL